MSTPAIDWAALDEAAKLAQSRSYSPYSTFRVGAALLNADGRILMGCNVENAGYAATICAEGNAATNAIVQDAREIVAASIIGDTTDTFTAPCGNCRQILFELNPKMQVHMMGINGHDLFATLDEGLLPHGFGGSVLPHH